MVSFLNIKIIRHSQIMFCCTYSANSATMLTYCIVTAKMFTGSEKNRVLFILYSFYQYDEVRHHIPQPSIHYGTITLQTSSNKVGLCYCAVLLCSHIILVLIKCCDQKTLMTNHGDSKITQKQELQTTIHLIKKHVRYKQTH